MIDQHLRAEADAEERPVLLERNLQPVGLAADELVLVVGAHRPAEHHRAGMVVQRFRQGVAQRRAADVEVEAALRGAVADASGARILLMQHDQDLWPRTRLACIVRRDPVIRRSTFRGARRLRAAALRRACDAVAALDTDQLGDAPDRVVLQLVQLAVGIDDLPHQADERLAPVLVEMALQHAGEGIEVDRLIVGPLAGGDQRLELGAADRIALRQHRLEAAPTRRPGARRRRSSTW